MIGSDLCYNDPVDCSRVQEGGYNVNRRNVLLIVVAVLVVVGAQVAAAQNLAMPQAVVSVRLTVLRDAPSHAGGFVAALPESAQVALLGVDGTGSWFQVETPDGVQAWGRALHFAPLSRARAVRTLVLFEAPADNINYVVGVEADTELLILGTDESGEWTQVLSPDGETGWTETALLRFDYGIARESNITLYNWPDSDSAQVTATLEAMTPVYIEDALAGGDWIRVRTGTGQSGWAFGAQFSRTDHITPGLVSLTQSENANLRALPAIDAPSTGAITSGQEVWVVGRDQTGGWLLIVPANGQLSWIASGLVDLLGGAGVDALPVLTP